MPKIKPNHQNRFNPYGFVPYQEPTKTFKCNIDKCCASFPYKSVLRVHQMKQHVNDLRFKQPQIAIVEPFTRIASLSLISWPQKKTTFPAKQPTIILRDILAKEHYTLDEHDEFNCPVCDKSTTSKSMIDHLYSKHKSLVKLIKPKVRCTDCLNNST